MRTLTQNLDNLYTVTFYNRRQGLVDNIFTATPFWYLMTKNGRSKGDSGGRKIEVELEYGKNETVKGFGKGDHFDLTEGEFLTVAHYDWKYVGGSIMRYWVDEQQNRGKAKVMDYVNSKIGNLERSMIGKLEKWLFGDGTDDNGKAIDGLAKLVASLPTSGVVGNIDRATHSWWRNNYKDMSGEDVSVYLRRRMATMFNDCGKQGEGVGRFPDLMVCAQNVYEAYENELVEIKQIVNKEVGDMGFGDLTFKGRPMTWSPDCPDGYLYFINTNFLFWIYDNFAQMEMTEWKSIPNQANDRVAQVVMVGNLVATNCKRQGVIHSITP